MQADPRFADEYVLVTMESKEPDPRARFTRTQIWVRRESDRIGVMRTPHRIEVPGYLLTGGGAVARLVPGEDFPRREEGPRFPRLALWLGSDPAGLRRIRLESGHWSATARASTAVDVWFVDSASGEILASERERAEIAIRANESALVDLLVVPRSASTVVDEVVLGS